jgi:choline dehydrogenase-like flavoprotein
MEADCDYVIVGSGAGGGTLAARLAERGFRITLLEAGGDARDADKPRMPTDYDIPAFHAFASENPAMAWSYFVRHYENGMQQRRDPKYRETWNGRRVDGVLYPRAATLGGCTAHNAMIVMFPPDSDWDGIAELTGDPSWRAGRMTVYRKRVENCRHRPLWRLLHHFGIDPTGHGWNGWLSVEQAMPLSMVRDPRLLWSLIDSAIAILRAEDRPVRALLNFLLGQADPGDRRTMNDGHEHVCYTPLSTRGHARSAVRERLLQVQKRHRDRLHIEYDALATRVLFDEDDRAMGVEYRKGARLYRAHTDPAANAGEIRTVRAGREVILAGGAFNTPQILMLSGIGPSAHLAEHGIAVRVDLRGVGANLQDRYEVGVVHRMAEPWRCLKGARFEADDALARAWSRNHDCMYASNGALIGLTKRSAVAGGPADLFAMAMLADFRGYFPDYSKLIASHSDRLTWAVLKAHTLNRAGTVRLASSDPRDMPAIDFHYFEEGSDQTGTDLAAVVEALRLVRAAARPLREKGLIAEEELPGETVHSDAAIAQYAHDNAWGHHASCSCAIGPRDAGGVLDSDFRVHGTKGLRVADASVFPRIPGFFVTAAIYMIAEKAADDICRDAREGRW